jgi:hypothetical protein
VRRALLDLRAVPGLAGKLRFIAAKLFPPAAFLRARYPDRQAAPIIWLHLLRLYDFVRRRPEGAGR